MGYAEAQYAIDEVNNTTGIPPMPVTDVNVRIKDGNTLIYFRVSDLVLNRYTICYVGKVVIVRKVESEPTSINDGTVVATIDREHVFNYTDYPYIIEGYSEEAYYAFFVISDHGVICKESVIKKSTSMIYRFAYHQDYTSDPDKTITYLNWGNLNSSATPMHTNEDTGTVTYGDFENLFILKENKPYMVKSDWTADYALDPDDYTKKLDGSDSDVSNISYEGLGAYAWIPKFYIKTAGSSSSGGRDVYFSNEKEDDDFYPVGFDDYSVGEVEGLWIPMYYIGSDGKSIAGRTGYGGATYKNTDAQKAIIDLNGANARFLGGSIMNALRDLMYGLYKSTDIQKHGGYGNCYGYDASPSLNYGMTKNPVLQNGIVSGFKGTGNTSNRYSRTRANKAFHSNVLFTYDMYLRDPYTLYFNTGDSVSTGIIRIRTKYAYNLDGSIEDTNDAVFSSSRRYSGYTTGLEKSVSGDGYKQYRAGGSSTGSATTYLCDYASLGTAKSATYVATLLGYCNDDLKAGPSMNILTNGATYSSYYVSAAPLLIPPANYTPS